MVTISQHMRCHIKAYEIVRFNGESCLKPANLCELFECCIARKILSCSLHGCAC